MIFVCRFKAAETPYEPIGVSSGTKNKKAQRLLSLHLKVQLKLITINFSFFEVIVYIEILPVAVLKLLIRVSNFGQLKLKIKQIVRLHLSSVK